MSYTLVRLKVEDYAKWKPFFDQNGTVRKGSGSKGARVFRSAENPNEVTILSEWDNLRNAQQFYQSAELREVMGKAGVIGKPDITFLDQADARSA